MPNTSNPDVTIKIVPNDVVFEIDHTYEDVLRTLTLTHREAHILRDKLSAAFKQLSRNYGIVTPKQKAYLTKRSKIDPQTLTLK